MDDHKHTDMSSVSTCPSITRVGFKFEPSPQQIFLHFLPKKILGQQVFPPPDENLIKEIDLYGDKTPEEIFGEYDTDDSTKFYFYVQLKKTTESSTRNKRVAGGGTWQGERPDDFSTMIDGKVMKLGTKRLFKFKLNNNKQDSGSGSWLLHEYKVDKDFLFCFLMKNQQQQEQQVVVDYAQSLASLCDSLAFCRVYKKPEKKKKNLEFLLMNNKRKLVPCDHGTSNMVAKETKKTRTCDFMVVEETNKTRSCDFLPLDNNTSSAVTSSHVLDIIRSMEEALFGAEEEEEEAVDSFSATELPTMVGNDQLDLEAWLNNSLDADEATWGKK